MAKYAIGGYVTISIYTEVEASTPEEARALSLDKPMISLCHQCASGSPDDEWITSGELDGEAEITSVSEL